MPKTMTLVERRPDTSLMGRAMDAVRSYWMGPMSLKDPALAEFFGGGRTTSAGIHVNDVVALTFSAVFSAIDQISSDVAKVPLNLRKRRQTGGSDLYTDAKLYRILKDEANPDMSAFVFRRTMTAHALSLGNGYAEIERDGAGRPVALWGLTPDRVQPFLEKEKLQNGLYRSRLRYRIDGAVVLDSKDVLHIQGLGYDGYKGYSLINQARQSIGLALAAEQFGATFFGNGTTFGGVMSTDQTIGPDAEKIIKASVNAYHASADKAHRLLFLSGGWKYTKTGVAPNEAQMDELRDKQVEEVARFFNIPLHKLKLNKPGAVSYSSVEMADLDYYKGSLLNWYVNWEQECNRKLISPSEFKQQFIKHNVDAFMRADSAGRTALYSALLDRGVYCADDVLELEDLNPQPNGQGKMFLVQGAMVPKDQLVAVVDANIQKAKTKAQPPPPPAPPVDPQQASALLDAMTRAERADEAVVAATADARAEREARIALEATGTARADEIARRVEAEQVLIARAAELDVIAAGLRAEAESLREAQAQGVAEIVRLRAESEERRASLDAVTSERDARASDVAGQAGRLAGLDAELAAARVDLASALEGLETSRQAMTDLEANRARLEADLVTVRTEQEQLRAQQSAALAAEVEATAARAGAEQRATEAAGAVAEARGAVDRSLEEVRRLAADQQGDRAAREAAEQRAAAADVARQAAIKAADALRIEADAAGARAEQAQTERDTIQALLDAGDARVAELDAREQRAELDRQAAAQALADLEARMAVSTAAADELSQQLAAQAVVMAGLERDVRDVREADARGVAAVIAAHRGLVADIMRRMIERETDRLRRGQATPEKLRTAIEAFYDGYLDLLRTALAPAVTVHLAFIRSDEDPQDAARRLAEGHVRDSRRQLEAALDGPDPDVYAGSMTALWHRWETERSTQIADALMQAELDYVRQR